MGEISYVAQDNFLFDKSIRENIRMGNPDASDEEVEAAAKRQLPRLYHAVRAGL